MQKSRNMKVYGMSGYKYRATPTIMLKGQWLKELGFDIGSYVSVSCENGKLVITPDTEKEMKLLQKKFEAEKEKLRARFVAEKTAEYGVCSEQGV